MKTEISEVTDLNTGETVNVTYLIPENESDLAMLRRRGATGQVDAHINPQDLEAELDDDDAQNRLDALQDAEAERIRSMLDVSLIQD